MDQARLRAFTLGSAVALFLSCSGDKEQTSTVPVQSATAPADVDAAVSDATGGDDDDEDENDGEDSDGTTPGSLLPPTSKAYDVDATGESKLDRATLDALKAGGDACRTKILYPYDGTVFPGGLGAPQLMWEGSADAAYVRVRYRGQEVLDFEYAVGATNPGQLKIPVKHWNEITRRTQGAPLELTLSVKTGGSISTCKTSWEIAAGNMVGSLYYNTYNHPDAGGVGAVLRLTLGANQPQVYLNTPGIPPTGPCVSCHSVSFDGSRLAASTHFYGPLAQSFDVATYEVTQSLQPQPRTIDNAAYAAFTPDGKYLLTMGNPDCTNGADTWPRASNNIAFVEGPTEAKLLDVSTGKPVSAPGLSRDWYMWMPQFSPDGDQVVFNHARRGLDGRTTRRDLAIASYDPVTHAFGAPKIIYSGTKVPDKNYAPLSGSPGGELYAGISSGGCFGSAGTGPIPMGACTSPCFPAWPFFTPDGKGVIFSLISEPDFASAVPGRSTPAKSELWYADITDPSHPRSVRLDNANRALAGESTLDNYYPTVLPIQVGGYYWVFWTSMRKWGHKNMIGGTFSVPLDPSYVEAVKKRIWVSAIRPVSGGLTDPSSPAFYLEGQSETGNTRAFATLNPCKPSGKSCQSGLDCCTGYCERDPESSEGVCVEEVECAQLNEKCEDASDCCPPASSDDSPAQCLGGYCGFLVVR